MPIENDAVASATDDTVASATDATVASATDPASARPRRTRVTLTKDGPALIEGPVDLVTDDGRTVHCDRFVVAVCTCRRSGIYPLCDTTHRRRRRKKAS